MDQAIRHKPKFTFPEAEGARVILENDSGRSTVLAGEQLGATVLSVESDRDWASGWASDWAAWIDANPPLANSRAHGPLRPDQSRLSSRG